MDEAEYKRRLVDAVNNPRLTCLFLEVQMQPKGAERHFAEAFNGIVALKEWVQTHRDEAFEQAARQLSYVQDEDKKYVRAIAYYGLALIGAFYQSPQGFALAYRQLDNLIEMSLWSPLHENFIQDLQTEARHLKADIRERDRALFPFGAMWRRWTSD